MIVHTESGASYHIIFLSAGKEFMRSAPAGSKPTQWDNLWVKFVFMEAPSLRKPMDLVCEPLSPGGEITLVRTSPVTRVEMER